MSGFNARLDRLLSGTSSRLAVGLDPDPERLPSGVRPDRAGLVRFLTAVVDATAEHTVAFKPNSAFYEALGEDGMAALEDVGDHVREATDCLWLLDAKRGDVGHTADRYAHAAFEVHKADAITVSGYLGWDAVEPFARDASKGVFVLARTTNPGAAEVQEAMVKRAPGKEGEKKEEMKEDVPLYLLVARLVREWDEKGNLGLVAGATNPSTLGRIRQAVGDTVPILVPGVGAQGGDVKAAVEKAADRHGRAFLVAASRSVIYAGSGQDYAAKAEVAARALAQRIAAALPVPNP